ncbi:TPA: phage antirepressor KilAC domain-containing protein [Streptococcus equi subsp. zooepidemicus]|nr:phage antirepressor KilAC domain-containing protein [Streptococcus equi subsp. zooepidemicus]
MTRFAIQRLREEKKMSQEELANKSGVSRTTISLIETDKSTTVKLSTLQKLAVALEVPIGYFFKQNTRKDNMNNLITVTLNDNQEPVVSARDLYKELKVKTRFSEWVKQNFKILEEGYDFTSVVGTTVVNNGAVREIQDYALSLDAAKNLAMVSKTDKGKEVRQYFIRVEKDFNSPEKIMARALLMADKKVHKLEAQIEADRPKVLFADAVSASKSSCLIGELAKILKQNGINIGQNKLFQWLRANGYLISRRGESWNQPTQKSMQLGLFELKKTAINHSDGHTTTNVTPKVTGKGQQYFINKFLNQEYLPV